MLIKLPTEKTVSEVAVALQFAVQANHFGIRQVYSLQETTTEKGDEFARECLMFEVCQRQQMKNVLAENMCVSNALPCWISVYEEGGKAVIAALKLTTLLEMFNVPQLGGVAQAVEATVVKIMTEAASRR